MLKMRYAKLQAPISKLHGERCASCASVIGWGGGKMREAKVQAPISELQRGRCASCAKPCCPARRTTHREDARDAQLDESVREITDWRVVTSRKVLPALGLGVKCHCLTGGDKSGHLVTFLGGGGRRRGAVVFRFQRAVRVRTLIPSVSPKGRREKEGPPSIGHAGNVRQGGDEEWQGFMRGRNSFVNSCPPVVHRGEGYPRTLHGRSAAVGRAEREVDLRAEDVENGAEREPSPQVFLSRPVLKLLPHPSFLLILVRERQHGTRRM